MKKTIIIEGMSCNHCVKRVTNALNNIEGVKANVNLETKTADVNVTDGVTDEVLINAIEDAGYKVASIK